MKIKLDHPITHDGVEYGRGIHDVKDSLAKVFLVEAPHAATVHDDASGPQAGETSAAPDTTSTVDIASHTMKAEDVIELVQEEPDIAQLKAYLAGERQKPNGPRKSVIAAIEERIAELKKE